MLYLVVFVVATFVVMIGKTFHSVDIFLHSVDIHSKFTWIVFFEYPLIFVSLDLQSLRMQEGNDAQVCFYIIHLLLFKTSDFRGRVQEFVKENSPQHWKHSNWWVAEEFLVLLFTSLAAFCWFLSHRLQHKHMSVQNACSSGKSGKLGKFREFWIFFLGY